MRIVTFLFLLLAATATFADAGQANCARLQDAFNNIADKAVLTENATAARDALIVLHGSDPNSAEPAQTKCGYALTTLKRFVKRAIELKKSADAGTPSSSELD